ncbi:MAG: tryptophan 2,3-dioxygenase family protein [Bdellovibrionota bacterium]
MALNYSDYLELDKILDAQHPKSIDEHDETLFIVVHQVYELWFKQILHEGAFLQKKLEEGDGYTSMATLKRMLTVLKTMVAQTDVIETMTPVSFSAFRDRLETASGFQSGQYRIFEFFLGNRNPKKIEIHMKGSQTRKILEEMVNKPTLYDSFLRYLRKCDVTIPDEVINRDFSKAYESNQQVQASLIKIYQNDPALTQICESFVDLDEGIQEWRYRHVKMVERTIGNRMGTGGSSGVEFLKGTLFKPAFKDLWEIRTSL